MTLVPLSVSNDQMEAYFDLCASLARRYTGYHGAEYDDLFQEGQVACFMAIRKGDLPSKDIVAFQMLKWVTKCARQGFTGYDDKEEAECTQ